MTKPTDNSFPKTISYFAPAMLLFFLLRCAFLAFNFRSFTKTHVTLILKAFAFGTMIDSSVTATTLLVFFLVEWLNGHFLRWHGLKRFLKWGIHAVFCVYFLMNATDIFYFQHAHSRFNLDVLEGLSQFGPIWQTMIESRHYFLFLVLGLALTGIVTALFGRLARLRLFDPGRLEIRGKQVATFIFLFAATFLYLKEPFWRLPWVSSATQAVRQLKMNGVYTLVDDIRLKSILRREHRDLASKENDLEAFKIFREWRLGQNEHFTSSVFPLCRRITHPHYLAVRKPNIVLVVMEGFSAVPVGALRPDHKGLSPNIDKLASEGILFTNFYAHETRTHHGVVSITASFPSLLGTFLTRRYGTTSFYTAFNLLRAYGYKTSFVYGYDSHFDHKASYFSQGGVDEILDEKTYRTWKYKGVWGVSDEDVFDKANNRFRSYPADQPFIGMILTGSNHAPYHLPDYFALAHAGLGNNYNSTFDYADWSIGRFMALAKKEAYFDNTIFVFVADHGEPVDPSGDRLKRFHIPLVLYSPKLLPKHERIDRIGAQADIMPTLFHLIGYPYDFHFVGRDLLTDTDKHTGHLAIMHDGTDFIVRWRDYALIADSEGQYSRLYAVKPNSYLGAQVKDPAIEEKLKRILDHYTRGLYHIFYNGLHQVPNLSTESGASAS